MLLITVGILAALFLISYKIFDKDLFAPPTIVCLSFLFTTTCALYNENRWALDFSVKTTLLLFIGIGAFILGGILAVFLSNTGNMHRFGFSHQLFPVHYIKIEKWKVVIVIAFQILLMVMLYREMTQKVGFIGIAWAEIMQIYRHESMQMVGEEITMKLSFLLRQFLSINRALAFLFSYVVGNNFASKKKISFLYLIPVLLACVISFMQGFRSDMLKYWVAIIVVWYTLYKRSIAWESSKETAKIIKKMILSIVVVAMVFTSVRFIVGRRGSATEGNDLLYYITFYGGCPIAAFDISLQESIQANSDEVWGKRTFWHLNQFLGRFNPKYQYSLVVKGGGFTRTNNGTIIGNVFTGFRAPIDDFGYGGLPAVMFPMGCFFTFFYCKVRKKHGLRKIDFSLLVYSYCAYTFFLYFFSSYYYFISADFIRTLLLWYVLRWFLTSKFKIVMGKNNC